MSERNCCLGVTFEDFRISSSSVPGYSLDRVQLSGHVDFCFGGVSKCWPSFSPKMGLADHSAFDTRCELRSVLRYSLGFKSLNKDGDGADTKVDSAGQFRHEAGWHQRAALARDRSDACRGAALRRITQQPVPWPRLAVAGGHDCSNGPYVDLASDWPS